MADPRVVDYEGLDPQVVTFAVDASTVAFDATKANGSASVGLAVTMDSSGKVALCADGEFVLGKLLSVESDGKCSVQTGGYMKLPAGTSASLTRGKAIVGDLLAAARGYIREVATATAAELGVCNGAIIDPADTEAVVVRL